MKTKRRKTEKTNRIGARVMQTRQKQGLTRKELCEILQHLGINMSVRTLSLLERQKRRVVDIEFLALSKALHVTMESLWGEEKKH